MDKKTFIKGIGVGVLVSSIAFFGVLIKAEEGLAFFSRKMDTEDKINYISALLNKLYVDEVDNEKMEDYIYKGMVSSIGDKYTEYLSKDEYKSYLDDSKGSFYGIGVSVTEDKGTGKVVIVNTLEVSPAAEVGVLAGDIITSVNGEDISGYSLDEVVKRMKGDKGTEVKITIYRESTKETKDFTIVRDEIISKSVEYSMIDKVAYININGFKSNTYEEYKKAYSELIKNNPKGLIIDVRNNPGGLFDVVGEIVDDIVGEGVYVYTIDKSGKKVDYNSDAKKVNIPVYVLVNEYSASASEILAGAVQDMGAGKLVGNKTFGKGLVQGLYSLPDGSGIKITIQKYYTPKGVCIQGEGITPDYLVELPEDYFFMGEVNLEKDTQLKKALELINK